MIFEGKLSDALMKFQPLGVTWSCVGFDRSSTTNAGFRASRIVRGRERGGMVGGIDSGQSFRTQTQVQPCHRGRI